MKKKIILLSLALMFLLGTFKIAKADDRQVKLVIDNKEVVSDVAPYIKNSRTLVPIRVISENLGYDVDWDQDRFKVTISDFEQSTKSFRKIFILTIDQNKIVEYAVEKVNQLLEKENLSQEEITASLLESAKISQTDIAPELKEERTFVPIRLIAELMGHTVDWDENTWTVSITK